MSDMVQKPRALSAAVFLLDPHVLLIGLLLLASVFWEMRAQGESTTSLHPPSLDALKARLDEAIDSKDFVAALPFAKQWVATNETVYGVDHTNTAKAIDLLADIYNNQGNYKNAGSLYERSLRIQEASASKNDPKLLTVLVRLAGAYSHAGEYEKALPLYQRVVEMVQAAYGTENVVTAKSLLFMANTYLSLCDYAKAEPLFQQTMDAFDRTIGQQNQYYAAVLSGLANLYFAEGDYAKAEPLYQRCESVLEETLGHTNSETARALNNLGYLYFKLNDYKRAEPFFLDSLKTLETTSGKNHPDVIDPLNNLAGIYYEKRDYSKVEPILQRCLSIITNASGQESPNSAKALNNMAEFYQDMGNDSKAEELLLQSLKIYRSTFLDNHPDTAVVLFNLAGLHGRKGDLSHAELMYRQALGIQEHVYGSNYPDKASDCRLLETLLIDEHKQAEALRYESQAQAARLSRVNLIFSFTSETQRMVYQRDQSPYDLLATLGNAPRLAETLLRNKAAVLDSLLEDWENAKSVKDPNINQIYAQLQPAARRLFKMETELPDDTSEAGLKEHREKIAGLESKVEGLQKELARNTANLGKVRRAFGITLPEMQSAMLKNTILLEFVRYFHYLGTNSWEPRYGAVLIGNNNEPVWVSLGAAANIESNLLLYANLMRSRDRGEAEVLKSLYAQLFKPVLKQLPANMTNLIICPDAELNFLSFATLMDEQDEFLAEHYNISYVASGRDLVYGKTVTQGKGELVAFANPSFNLVPGTLGNTNATELAMLSSDRRDYNGITLAQLPNTLKEADFLKTNSLAWKLTGKIYEGSDATEAQVKSLRSPYILHLATHGFFLPDTTTTNDNRNLSLNDRMPVVLHNPMQRSGLALAGAQVTLDAWKRGEVPDTENDGILMAQEVGLLDLQNTWLVVLSACDTGIGEARAGEGVMGLRRGFIQAGAQNLLMTLWPVSDKWTVDMMEAFYLKAMKTKDAPGALASVQRDFLKKLRVEKNPVLAARLAGPFVMNFQGRPSNN